MKKSSSSMNDRLRNARIAAGFVSATDAIEYCGWKSSTYRAHENGQNNFKIEDASRYSKAYGVSAAWLLIGDATEVSKKEIIKNKSSAQITTGCSLAKCPGKIQSLALLLKKDPVNIGYVKQLNDCVSSYYELLQNKK